MTDVPPGTRVVVNYFPRPIRDVLTTVLWTPNPPTVELVFEKRNVHFARNHLARPSGLIRLAFKIWWHDVKLFFCGLPRRGMETVASFRGSIPDEGDGIETLLCERVAELQQQIDNYARTHPLTLGECETILNEMNRQRLRAEDMGKVVQGLRERGKVSINDIREAAGLAKGPHGS